MPGGSSGLTISCVRVLMRTTPQENPGMSAQAAETVPEPAEDRVCRFPAHQIDVRLPVAGVAGVIEAVCLNPSPPSDDGRPAGSGHRSVSEDQRLRPQNVTDLKNVSPRVMCMTSSPFEGFQLRRRNADLNLRFVIEKNEEQIRPAQRLEERGKTSSGSSSWSSATMSSP